MPHARILRVGSRDSALALTQTKLVISLLSAKNPGLHCEIVAYKTRGDSFLDVSLSKVGGKGLFVDEIEDALLAGAVDFAVHSLKDMPAELKPGCVIASIPEREDPSDVLVLPVDSSTGRSPGHSSGADGPDGASLLMSLPSGARVGTSSLRRAAQILALRRDLHVEPVRGNVPTRLRKLDEGQFDALVLASAGLKRLQLAHRINAVFPLDAVLPAAGQGALGLECRADDAEVVTLLKTIEDPVTACAVAAERAFLGRLGGSCQVPIAAYADLSGARISLRGRVLLPDGSADVSGRREGCCDDAATLGRQLAQELLDRGAGEILHQAQTAAAAEGSDPGGE